MNKILFSIALSTFLIAGISAYYSRCPQEYDWLVHEGDVIQMQFVILKREGTILKTFCVDPEKHMWIIRWKEKGVA